MASGTDGVGMFSRSTVGSATPFYFECERPSNTSIEYGITNGTQVLVDNNGSEPNKGVAIYFNGTHWYWYSDNIPDYSQISTGAGSAGDRLCVAVDPVNGRAWARLNSGNWNNSGTADPATNTGGINISDFGSTLYAWVKSSYTYTPATVYLTSGDWTHSAPSGFGGIDDAQDDDGWDITRASVPSLFQLSNGDRTVTRTDPSGDQTIQSKWFKTTGKWYYEVLWTEPTGFASGAGFVEDSYGPLASGDYLGATNTVSEGGFNDSDNWNAANAGYWDAPFNDGDILCVALDLDNDRSWSRRNNGSWFGVNSTPGDPATNTGGHVIGAGLTGAIRAIAQIADPGTRPIATSAFKASQWTYSAPSGFSAPVADSASAENIWFQQTAFQIWPYVSSGTTYNEDIDEAFALTDAFGGVAVFLRAITESTALTDAFGGTASFVRAMTESVATSDAYTGTAVFPRSITESVATSDAFTGTMAATGAIAESVALADAPAASLTLSAAVAETMAATDAPSASLTMLGAIAESVALTDAPNATAVFNRVVAESVALTDAQAANITMAAAIAESMAATDAFAGGLLFVVAVNESIALTDAQTGLLVMLCERAEIMSIADSQSATASLVVGITESVATADSVNAALSAIGALAETIATSDAYSGGSVYAMTVNESIGIADSQSVLVTLVGTVAEAIALADTAGTTLVAVAQVAETIATSDVYNEDGPAPPGTDEYRVGGGSVQELLQTLTVSTIHHTQKKTGPS
jgi:hypothetical protein